MENRKLPKKREYLNDFKLNEEGKYEYIGTYHTLDESKASFKSVKRNLLLEMLSIVLMYGIAGCVRAVGVMNAVYVTFPYVFGFFVAAILAFKVLELFFGRYPIRDYDYKSTVLKLKGFLLILLVLTLCTLIGELFYIIRYGIEMYLSGTIVFVFCMILALVFTLILYKYNEKLVWLETNK